MRMYGAALGIACVLWYSAYIHAQSIAEVLGFQSSEEKIESILACIPWWCLITFGSYCFVRLGFDLLSFNDCPEVHAFNLCSLFTKKKLALNSNLSNTNLHSLTRKYEFWREKLWKRKPGFERKDSRYGDSFITERNE